MTQPPQKKRTRSAASRSALKSVFAVLSAMSGDRLKLAIPVVVVLLVFAVALVVLSLFPAISPFVYPLL